MDYSHHISYLKEGSVWVDTNKRTIVVWRVHWQNTANVGSYELLIIDDMKLVKRQASEIEKYVRTGKMQYCRELKE